MKRAILALVGLFVLATVAPAHALETGKRVLVKVKGGSACIGTITETVGNAARVKFDEIGRSEVFNCRIKTGDLLPQRFMEIAFESTEVTNGPGIFGGGTKISVGDKIVISVERGNSCLASAKMIVNRYIQVSMSPEQMVGDCQYLDLDFVALPYVVLAK